MPGVPEPRAPGSRLQPRDTAAEEEGQDVEDE